MPLPHYIEPVVRPSRCNLMNFQQLHTGKPAELSEMQNYAYWNAHFPPGTHDLHYRFTEMIRDERENIFNCTRLRFEQHKHGEKKISLRICMSSFVHCYGKQKRLRIVEKSGTAVSRIRYYRNVRLTKVPNEATLQAVQWKISVQAECLDE